MNNAPPAQGNNFFSQYNYKKSSSPGLMLADLILKGIPIGVYIASWFFSAFIIELAVITVVSSLEFWFTKNVLGRVMVGLRWGRVIHEDGEEEFVYECKRDEKQINANDKRMFWGFLGLAFVFWLAMFVWNIFTWKSLVVILVPLVLLGTNLYCFYRCSAEQQEQMKAFIQTQKTNLTQRAVDEVIANN